jgi:hypothetical protein
MERKHIHMCQAFQVQPHRELPHGIHQDPMHPCHIINPKEASPDELESATWTSHGSKGPLGEQTDSKCYIHPE